MWYFCIQDIALAPHLGQRLVAKIPGKPSAHRLWM